VDDERMVVFARCYCKSPWGATAEDLLYHILELSPLEASPTSFSR
jgi:hypothetical protein